MHRPLHDGWTLRPVDPAPLAHWDGAPIPATVPGTVHTDLLAAGLIPDPFLDDNERRLAWIGLTDWRYETTFAWEPDDGRTDLVFDGLDTVARVEVNGHLVGETFNMHRTYRFAVDGLLRPGENTLAVTFASAVRFADQASLEQGARPHVNHHPYNAIRKMACNFGWDWGPDLVTAGIWRPAALQSWSVARLHEVRPVTTVDGQDGRLDLHVEVAREDTRPLTVTATIDTHTVTVPVDGAHAGLHLVVPEVRRWWPRGYGEQPRYDLTVTLHDGETTVDTWSAQVGFRRLHLEVEPDEAGTRVTFVVNDQPVFVKGANWIPDDALPHRVTRERYAARLDQAERAGLNLLRVWGGGIYEADEFYDECDRRGILTWQDFLFTCAAYPEEEPLRSEVEAEARDNVARLMAHPSLVLWNGNNESLWGFVDWDWARRLDGQTWGHGYYHELLPAVVGELDPGRPYTPGSPWSFTEQRHPNDAGHGTMHIWDVWNELDYLSYRAHRPRFVAEFGWQGPPTWSTLRRALSDDPLTPESPGMLVHQKAAEGHRKLVAGLVDHLRVPSTMDDWHWAMSLNQARAVRTGIEYFRSLAPHCTGSVMWQLNDCWPVVSWAAVDGDGRAKPLLYALGQAHADRLVTIQPGPDGLTAILVNDTDAEWTGPLRLARRRFDGKAVVEVQAEVTVSPRATLRMDVPAAVAVPDEPTAEVLVAAVDDVRGLWSFVEDRDADLPEPSLDVEVQPADSGYLVTVTAQTFVRELALLVDKLDPGAVVDGMLATLFPGESVTWHITTAAELDLADLRHPSVLRSANQLVSGAVARSRSFEL